MSVKVDKDKCEGCGHCVIACKMDTIEIKDGKASIVGECMECGICADECPNDAITL